MDVVWRRAVKTTPRQSQRAESGILPQGGFRRAALSCVRADSQKGPEDPFPVRRSGPRPATPQTLRVPLDCPYRQVSVGQRLHGTVRRPLDRLQSGAQPLDGLVMGAVDDALLSIQPPQDGRRRADAVQPVDT